MHGSDSKAIQSPTHSGRFLILPPPGTLTLCLLTLSGSVAQSIADNGEWTQAVGVVPANVWHFSAYAGIAEVQVIPVWVTLFAYLFLHGGWSQVLSNMLGLWVFGAIAEPVMGTWRFVLTYFLAGIVGALGIGLVLPQSSAAVAGASLAISGLLGAYAALRWMSQPHGRAADRLVLVLEAAAVASVAGWLLLRTVPMTPDLTCSLIYHFIPGLVMWLGVRVVKGGQLLFGRF
jgi:membrane associated rhomboid family serine protease